MNGMGDMGRMVPDAMSSKDRHHARIHGYHNIHQSKEFRFASNTPELYENQRQETLALSQRLQDEKSKKVKGNRMNRDLPCGVSQVSKADRSPLFLLNRF